MNNTNISFHRQHAAMLLKYAGISFVSGAVNHGFFSGVRSLWTAGAGIVLFVGGAWMEHRFSDGDRDTSLARTLLWGTLLSIGLGFFTGGLQHFPDSPERSAWVVPLGFALSAVALVASASLTWRRGTVAYALGGLMLISAGSVSTWQWLAANPQLAGVPHAHGDESLRTLRAQVVTRSIEVRMHDTMRFTPEVIEASAGETLRIVVRNEGQVEHELVIGDDARILEHAQAMQSGAAHAHGDGAAITVAPGQVGELVVTFPTATTLQLACLVPGHYEAGMRGKLTVAASAQAAGQGEHHKH